MTREELYKEAMKAFKNPDTQLSKNLKIHRERYMLRNKDKLTKKSDKDLDKLKVQPKLKEKYPGTRIKLSKEQLDKIKQSGDTYYSKGGAANSRVKTIDYRKGGMVLSTVDNRKNK